MGREAEGARAHQEAAEAEEGEARLAEADAPDNFPGLVAGVVRKGLLGGFAEEIDEATVIGLAKIVEAPAEEEVDVKFAVKFGKSSFRIG